MHTMCAHPNPLLNCIKISQIFYGFYFSHFSKGILNGEECVLHFSASVFTLMTIRIQRPFMLKVPLVSTNIQSNMYITLVSRFANA